jgi:hypothetical protein
MSVAVQALDWVQVLPFWLRVVVLAVVLGLLVWKLATGPLLRLTREFSPKALALVLERRFPQLLGDRLFTAVELSDLRLAREYGYSEQMVGLTVRQADERVGRVEFGKVFNWGRLWLRAGAFVALLVVPLPVVAAAYFLTSESPTATECLYRCRDVAGIWFDRNVRLADMIWPRRAHLEVTRPVETDIRIGLETTAPRIHVRAVKWVRGDRHAPGGWRALTWADLRESPELLGEPAPPLPIDLFAAAARLAPGTTESDWTVDRVESLLFDNPTFRQASYQQDSRLAAVRQVLEDRLIARASDPSMYRRLRKLEVPDRLELIYSGTNTNGVTPLERTPGLDYDYEGGINDLKESVRFTVRGLDYFTETRKITFLPPPWLSSLSRDELQPAYLYHRVLDDPLWLKGKRQEFRDRGVSLTGPVSSFTVPAGTEVILHGEADKPLGSVILKLRSRKGDAGESGPLPEAVLGPGGLTFSIRFPPLTRSVEFDCELSDPDNVSSKRPVRIDVAEDRSPEVDVLVEVIRKSEARGGLVCTPNAMIPFSGKVLDDYGLAKVEYVYSVQVLDQRRTAGHAAVAAGVLQALPSPVNPLGGLLLPPTTALAAEIVGRDEDTAVEEPPVPLETFRERLALESRGDPGKEELLQIFHQPISEGRQIRLHELKTEWVSKQPPLEFFDLEKVKNVQATLGNQASYRLRLTVRATDGNVESGPRAGRNKEMFNILVISEPELRIEISDDQEKLNKKMREVKAQLDDAAEKLKAVAETGYRYDPAKQEIEFATARARADEVAKTVARCRTATQGIYADYSRILKEVQLNRMAPTTLERVQDIHTRLEGVLKKKAEFERAEAGTAALQVLMNENRTPPREVGDQAVKETAALLDALQKIIDAMGIIFDKQQAIAELEGLIKGVSQSEEKLGTIKKFIGDDFEKYTRRLILIGPSPVTVDAGKKVTVAVRRDPLAKDEFKEKPVTVKIAVPTGSDLQAPPTVILPRGATEATFELTAGSKPGSYRVRADPQEGRPVILTVNVK